MNDTELELKSIDYRKKLLTYIKKAKGGHTAGSLSCVDILNVLYNRILKVSPDTIDDPQRDRYIQSKGHSVEALYVVLADCGFFPEANLDTMSCYGSHYVGHPTRKINGIEQNTGGLGHGLSVCVGMALAAKMDRSSFRVFTLLGDGELAEGSNWEAMMTASHYKLDNLIAIVDRNRLQITGSTEEVCDPEPLIDKFKAFGWSVRVVDGHSIPELTKTFKSISFESQIPSMIIAETVKGKGVSFMENNVKWHHGAPNDDQYYAAIDELNQVRKSIESEEK